MVTHHSEMTTGAQADASLLEFVDAKEPAAAAGYGKVRGPAPQYSPPYPTVRLSVR